MFVFTMKASGIKFFAVLTVAVAVLVLLISFLPAISAASDAAAVTTDYRNIEDEGDMIGFLKGFGYETESNACETYELTIPEEFNGVFEKYNEIQRAQGLNLKRYPGKSATAYVFRVTNYGTEGDVFATLFVRGGRIIAGDISSPAGEGFVHGFRREA